MYLLRCQAVGYTGRELQELCSYSEGRISKFVNYKDKPDADVLERIITRCYWLLSEDKKYNADELLAMSQNKTGIFLEYSQTPRVNASPKKTFTPGEHVASATNHTKRKRLGFGSSAAGTEGGATRRQKAEPAPLVVTVTTRNDRIAALK